jgi:phenylacetyl-CoA:acceptor oxidoreductase subunit 1
MSMKKNNRPAPLLSAGREMEERRRWGMLIDLRKCIGCESCVLVCREADKERPSFRRVVDCGLSGPPERLRNFLPISCMNCEKPPCLYACPTGATYQRPDGIVDIKEDLCLGCGYCVLACPYRARTIAHDYTWVSRKSQPSKKVGTCVKCNFCLGRIESGLKMGLMPGVDPEASPLCVMACSAGALCFGDLKDPASRISALLRENKAMRLQEELGTLASVFYIPFSGAVK